MADLNVHVSCGGYRILHTNAGVLTVPAFKPIHSGLRDPHVHVPTPGDHYSSTTGSAVMTRIYELAKVHERNAGSAIVLVGSGTRFDYDHAEFLLVDSAPLPNKGRKLFDALGGFAFAARPNIRACYKSSVEAIPKDYDGCVFIHNDAGSALSFRERLQKAKLYIVAQDELFRTFSRWETRKVIDAVDGIICVSEFLAERLRGRVGPSPKIFSLLNGVDIDRFTLDDQREESNTPTILFVGRIQHYKGPHLLIQAAHRLRSLKSKFKIKIVGRCNFAADAPWSPYERYLRQLASELSGSVEFVGFADRSEIVQHYQAADIFVAPSDWDEPCTLTVPEAMACGVPTVASRTGGIPEAGGDAAIYFQRGNATALSDLLEYLIVNPSIRREMRKRSRERAEKISWTNQYSKLKDFLER